MSDFEILQHLAGNGGRDAYHRGHAQDGGDTADAGDSQGHHEQGGDNQGTKRETGNRIIGRADHAAEVSGNGGEEEAQNYHYGSGHDGAGNDFSGTQVVCAGNEVVIKTDHGQEHKSDAKEDDLHVEVAVGTGGSLVSFRRFLQVEDGALHAYQ